MCCCAGASSSGQGSEVLPSAPGAALPFAGPQLRALLPSWCPTRCPCPGIRPQHWDALQGVRVLGFAPSLSIPVPPLTAGLARLWCRLCSGRKQNFGGIPGTKPPIWGQQLHVRVWGCVSCQNQGGGCWRTGTGGSQQLIGRLQLRRSLPGGTPSRRFFCAVHEPVPAPGVGKGRGVGSGPCPGLLAPSLRFCSPPVGSVLRHEAALSRAVSPPPCALHFSVWQQTGAVTHPAGALRGAEAGGCEGGTCLGLLAAPCPPPPGCTCGDCCDFGVCEPGIRPCFTQSSPRQGWQRPPCNHAAGKGSITSLGGALKPWGGHCADVPARRGVPMPGAPCPAGHPPGPPAAPRPEPVLPAISPSPRLPVWPQPPACRRISQGFCSCYTEAGKRWYFCVLSAPNQCLLLVSLGKKKKKERSLRPASPSLLSAWLLQLALYPAAIRVQPPGCRRRLGPRASPPCCFSESTPAR